MCNTTAGLLFTHFCLKILTSSFHYKNPQSRANETMSNTEKKLNIQKQNKKSTETNSAVL